jgi:Anti-sigma factor NepR
MLPTAAAHAFHGWTITADDTERRVARALRICIGNEIKRLYADIPNEPVPSKIADLLHRLDQ